MVAKKSILKVIGAALAASMLVIGCGKKEEAPPAPMAMPEVNDVNCQFDRVKALPAEIRTQFADKCATRSKPINSEKKSYSF